MDMNWNDLIPKGDSFSFGSNKIKLSGLSKANKRKEIREFVKEAVYKKYKGICQICDEKVDKHYDIAHKIPVKLNGSDDFSNLFPAHHWCNSSQGTKTLVETRKMAGKKVTADHKGTNKKNGGVGGKTSKGGDNNDFDPLQRIKDALG